MRLRLLPSAWRVMDGDRLVGTVGKAVDSSRGGTWWAMPPDRSFRDYFRSRGEAVDCLVDYDADREPALPLGV